MKRVFKLNGEVVKMNNAEFAEYAKTADLKETSRFNFEEQGEKFNKPVTEITHNVAKKPQVRKKATVTKKPRKSNKRIK